MRLPPFAPRPALAAAVLALAACGDRAPAAGMLAVSTPPAATRILNFEAAPPSFPIGLVPTAMVAADLDGDGRPDVAAVGPAGLAVLLGRPGGGFTDPRASDAGAAPSALAAGDFDGDGELDLAVAAPSGASFLRGRGDGTFEAPRGFTTGIAPAAIVAGDFDGDGMLDVAVVDSAAGFVSVLLGNGDGTFQAARPYDAFAGARMLFTGDVDGDGTLDLVAVGGRYIGALLGNGDGTFRAAPIFDLVQHDDLEDGRVVAAAVGDFDGDGKLDLALTLHGQDWNEAEVVVGNGDGTFHGHGDGVDLGFLRTTAIAAGDVDGDGKLDVVIGIVNGRVVAVARGDGRGGLTGPAFYGAGFTKAVAVADFDGDGKLDVAAADDLGGLDLLAGSDDGTLRAPSAFALGMAPVRLAVAPVRLAVGDFDGDGKLDVAASCYGDINAVTVARGDGHGGFAEAFSGESDVASSRAPIIAADFNRDGVLDVASADKATVLLGKGGTAFEPPRSYGRPSTGPMAVGDFDGDGDLDLVQIGQGLLLLRGKGDGTFPTQTPIDVGGVANDAEAADLDGDGKLDLVVAADAGLLVLFGKGDGTFDPVQLGDTGIAPPVSRVAVADLDRDGRLDIVVEDAGGLSVLRGVGGRTFRHATRVTGISGSRLAIADVDGDGIADVITGPQGSRFVAVLRGRGDGTLEDVRLFDTGTALQDFAVVDADRDGRPDLVVAGGDRFLRVLRNTSR